MKSLSKIFTLFLVTFTHVVMGQLRSTDENKVLRTVYLNKDVSTHFISPEPIQTVDISTSDVLGDLPVKNMLRIKPNADANPLGGVITIIGQTFIAQYKYLYTVADSADRQVSILPQEMKSFDHPDFTLSEQDFKNFSVSALKQKATFHNVRSSAFGMKATLNNIFTVGNYFFIDVEFMNQTNIQYDIDQFRFKIRDKRIVSATNVQSLEIQPVYQLYSPKVFKKKYRNIFVFEKFTFPGDKVFTIELAENQISGRVIYLDIEYSDVLNADAL